MRHVTNTLFFSLLTMLFVFSGCSDTKKNESVQETRQTTRPVITALDGVPETTSKASVTITLHGTADRDVYVNNVKTARTDNDGIATVTLDTAGADGQKRFTILIKDDTGNESDAYVVMIIKEKGYSETDTPTKAVTKLTLTATALELDENGSVKVTVKATYKDGTTEEVTPKVIWVVSDTSVATMHSDGTVRADHEGTATFQAKYGAKASPLLTVAVYKEIDGHRLPPEPDPEVNNATLLGIDSNSNGVRDDVERWIYLNYTNPVERATFMQSARAYQIVIQDPAKAKENLMYMHNAIDCRSYWRLSAKENNESFWMEEYRNYSKEIESIQFNTDERWEAYDAYNYNLSGGVYGSSEPDEWKSKCDFNMTDIPGN